MDPQGKLCMERVLWKGEAAKNGREYQRSLPLNSIQLTLSLESRPTWAVQAEVRSGYLKFDPRAENDVIKSSPTAGCVFLACTLEKVNNSEHGNDKIIVGADFYPVLYRMLQEKQKWDNGFNFRGRSYFDFGILEWTETILETYKATLYKAGIYGAVAVSRYPYEISKNVWRAFCELWGPLSNTLHFADGEMSISLYDLKVIGGLPISGVPYEEFLPTNTDLQRQGLYPPTVLELLQIHSALCTEYKHDDIYWDKWLNHFFRGDFIYASIGEGKPVAPKPRLAPKLALKCSEEGRLAAFLAFWLCRFVLPAWNKTIRPETFYMACLMAKGVKVSLAPTTLGYIYHCLGKIASHRLGETPTPKICLPMHYVIGWLGEHFPNLSKRRPDSDFAEDYPNLARYACVASKDFTITCARIIFRDGKSVVYRPHAFKEKDGCLLYDNESLSDERFDFLFCLRSGRLPVRVDGQLILEPYYPNRFARQFGYDQSVPSNRLSFNISKRKQCFVEELARAQFFLYQRNTTTRFYIPRSTYEGQCTWWYCMWWLKACTPYLGVSVSKTFKTFFKKSPEPEYRTFMVDKLAEISADLRLPVTISSLQKQKIHNPPVNESKIRQPASNKTNEKSMDLEKATDFRKASLTDTGLPSIATETRGMQRTHGRLASVVVAKPSADVQDVEQIDSDSSSGASSSNEKVIARSSKRKHDESFSISPQVIANHSATKSGVEKTVMPKKACISIEPLSTACVPSTEDVKSFLLSILDPGLASFTKDYIVGHVCDIFEKVSSSKVSSDLLIHCEEIKLALSLLHPVIESLKSGKTLFEKFTFTVGDMLMIATNSSKTMAILKEDTGVDIPFVSDLISDYERCIKMKEDLNSRLADSSKKLQDLQATEPEIKADEERVRQRRRKYESERISFEKTITLLKESIQEQEDQGQGLLKEKSDYMKERLPEIEYAISASKLDQEKYQESFASFISLFPAS